MLKPSTQRILFNARLNRLRVCRGRRGTKAAAIMASRLRAHPHALRREWYRGTMRIPMKTEEPYEAV